jgi:hypothetical protein
MLKVIVITISIFAFLVFIKNIEQTKENFRNNLRNNKFKENFTNHSIRNVHVDTEVDEGNSNVEENSSENVSVDEQASEEQASDEQVSDEQTSEEKCEVGKEKDGECLFGCGDSDAAKYSTPPETKPANLEDMMNTFEETEKICEAIEKKDKERRDREATENLEKQLQLNKKFLVQQKAQNKQIEDLQKLVKAMQFDEDMKKVAVEKCSGKADDCLSDKESRMNQILKMKEARKQNMKINLNIDPFGDEFKKKLMESLKLPDTEINKILAALKNGTISLDDIVSGNSVGIGQGSTDQKGIDGNGTQDKAGYDKSCPNCKVNLADYIDKCKIPCKNCRDPAWKCPQDVGGK